MTEMAWWLILGVALLLALAGALRFDVLGLFLRDRLQHPDETPGRVAANDAAAEPEPDAAPAAGAHHPAHGPHHRKPHYHRSGGRKS